MRTFTQLTRISFTGLLAALALIGCKRPMDTSNTKSLNNFARGSGDLSRNVCSGSQEVVMGIQNEWDHVDFSKVQDDQVSALKQALRSSLSAVPSNLQQVFFGLGGKIVFNPNLNEPAKSSADLTCETSASKDQFAKEGTSRVDACWTVDSKTMDFVLLINPTVQSVEHSTVRMFGYILSQILTKVGVSDAGIIESQRDEAFEQMLSDIGQAVISDVKKPGSKYSFAVNESLIHGEDFKYFAFAESFDSYYCNAALRQSMAKQDEFPQTFALFKQMDSELKKINMGSDPSKNSASASSGFSLADGGQEIGASGAAAMNLGYFRGGAPFSGIRSFLQNTGGAVIRGVGTLGRGVGAAGRFIFNGGRALVSGAGRTLGYAARGAGSLVSAVGRGAVRAGRFITGRR